MLTASQLFGLLLMVVAVVVFLYYTSWTILLPLDFFPFLSSWFPPKEYATVIPAAILTMVILLVGVFVSYISWNQARRAKMD